MPDENAILTAGAAQWRKTGAEWARIRAIGPGYDMGNPQICENAARELEILRDTGKEVHINTRCGAGKPPRQ